MPSIANNMAKKGSKKGTGKTAKNVTMAKAPAGGANKKTRQQTKSPVQDPSALDSRFGQVTPADTAIADELRKVKELLRAKEEEETRRIAESKKKDKRIAKLEEEKNAESKRRKLVNGGRWENVRMQDDERGNQETVHMIVKENIFKLMKYLPVGWWIVGTSDRCLYRIVMSKIDLPDGETIEGYWERKVARCLSREHSTRSTWVRNAMGKAYIGKLIISVLYYLCHKFHMMR